MKAISMKVPASLRIAKAARNAAATVSTHAIGLSLTFGASSFLGSALDAHSFASIAGLLSICSLYFMGEKGGER